MIRVIIADDDGMIRSLLKGYLRKTINGGVDIVAEVENGLEVESILEKNGADIVFLDINMPGRNGLEVLSDLKKSHGDTFVVIVSGDNNFKTIQDAMTRGANGFIVKPFTEKKIKEVIGKYESL